MSITVEERATMLVALLKSDFGQSGEDVWFYAIRDELKAHANAALEEAAKVAAEVDDHACFTTPCCYGANRGCHIAAAIRALREEE